MTYTEQDSLLHNLVTVRSNDKYLLLAEQTIRTLEELRTIWFTLPSWERQAYLDSCGQIKMYIPHLRGARERGELTRRQEQKLAELEHLYVKALNNLHWLKVWDKEGEE